MSKKWLKKCSNLLVVFALLISPFSNVASAVTNDTGTPITTQFIPYENSEGQMIYDPTNEPGISPDEVDFTSGSDGKNAVGDKPSFYVYGDSTNLYFRMRLLGDPYDRKGGFLSSVWNVDILVNGQHRATVGIDGKSPHVDYLFVASSDKSRVIEVSKTDSTGAAVPGTSISDAENGHYFLDFKVPITKIKEIVPDLDTSKPNVSFGFSTSKSANLRVVNKDGLEGAGKGASVKLSPFGIYKPTITYADITTYESVTPTITGTVNNAVTGSAVTLTIDGKNYTTTVSNGGWSIPLTSPLKVGTYDTTVKVVNEEGNIATARKTINVGTLISIDGPSVERVYKFPTRLGGKFVNSTGGAKKVKLTISKVTMENNVEIFTPVQGGSFANIQSDSTTKTWEKTGLSLNLEPGTYLVQAVEDTNGTNLPTASKRIVIVHPLTIEPPVKEDAKLVVKGNAEVGETVEVYIDNETVPYKSTAADTNGRWSVVIDRQLPTGTHTFKASTKDDYNNVVTTGMVSHTVTNITVSIANGDSTVSNDPTPTIYGKTSASNNGKVEVTVDNGPVVTATVTGGKWRLPLVNPLSEGPHTIQAIAKEGSLESAPDTQQLVLDLTTEVTIVAPSEYSKTNNVFTGTGEVLGDVIIQVDNGPTQIINLKEKSVSNNNWEFQTGALAYGNHTITVAGMDELGNINQTDGKEAKIIHEFTIVDPTKPVASDVSTYTIKNQSKSAKLVVSDQNMDSLNYNIKTHSEKGSVTIDSEGNWTYQPNSDQLGEDRFVVEVTNHLGNKTEVTVTIQIVALDVEINGLSDLRTEDHKPTFTGTAKKTENSVLTIQMMKEDRTVIETVTVPMDEDGDWTYEAPLLNAGKYILDAKIKDTELDKEIVDTQNITIYDASYKVSLIATPEKVIADGVSKVKLKALITDQDMKPVVNEKVSFSTEEGSLDQKEVTTDMYGMAIVELTTPDYYERTQSQVVKVSATVDNMEKNLHAQDDFLLTFVPAYVKGKVIDAITKNPVPGATIRVVGEGFSRNGTTDTLGNYLIPVNRANADYLIEISAVTTVDGKRVPISFTQTATVELVQDSERKANRTVTGQLLVINRETGQFEDIKTALGEVTITPEIVNPTAEIQVEPTDTGQYKVTGGEVGKTYTVHFNIQHSNTVFAGKKVDVTIPEDGQAAILPILIDPYGQVTEKETNKPIEGAEVTLYWANTDRNKELGRSADTQVELPALEGFAPNNNANPQYTSTLGLYAWMVYPEGDYYIVAKKEGYEEYNSLLEGRDVLGEDSFVEDGIIHVGNSIVHFDFQMELLPKTQNPTNQAPKGTDDEVTTLKNTKIDGNAIGQDEEGDTLTYKLGIDSQNGTAVVTSSGQWTYTPNQDFVGDDYFTILINDGYNSDVSMKVFVQVVKPNLVIEINGGASDRTVDRTPLLTGEAAGMQQGAVTILIRNHLGEMIDTAAAPVSDGQWSYQVQKELLPADYQVKTTLKDSYYNEQTSDNQVLTIVNVPLDIELTATPHTLVGDGKTKVTLKAVIKDEAGNPINNEKVTFDAELGTLLSKEAITNDKGEATVTLVAPDLGWNLETFSKKVKVTVHNPDKGLVDDETISITFVPARITGQVIDSKTGKPIPNATVTVDEDFNKDGNTDYSKAIQTGEDGSYSFIVPKSNWEYKLNIKAELTFDDSNVPVTFTQYAQVGETTGTGEEVKSEHTVIGQLFMQNAEQKIVGITDFIKDATYTGVVEGNHPNVKVSVSPKGQYIVTGGETGAIYNVAILVNVKNQNGDYVLAGQKLTVVIPEEGVASIEGSLVDPYGIVTDRETGKPFEGVEIRLYWADTELNASKNREPHSLVNLPELFSFAPNQNHNPQVTNTEGSYAWMVFPEGDYYIVATKQGYQEYSSLSEGRNVPGEDSYIKNGIIHVGQTIVNYDLQLTPNKAPLVQNDEVTVLKNREGTKQSDVTDLENDEISYKVGTVPSNGTVTITASGEWTYKPNKEFVGDDTFTIKVNDGHHEDIEFKVLVHVVKPYLGITIDGGDKQKVVDRTPLLTGDVKETMATAINLVIKNNIGEAVEEKLVEVQNGKWTYKVQKELTPGDYLVEATLTDTFYNETVVDTQTLNVVHLPLQIALSATPDSVVGDGKTEVTLKAVIKNVLGEPITDERVSFTSELGVLKATEAVTNTIGEATVKLVAPDLTGLTESIKNRLTVTVHNPNEGLVDSEDIDLLLVPNKAPVGQNQEVTTLKNTEINSILKVTDKESDSLTFRIASNATKGTATITASGEWTYKPNKDFVGDDTFTIKVNDGHHEDIEFKVLVHVVKPDLGISVDGGDKQTVVDRTPLLTGDVKETMATTINLVIKNNIGEAVEEKLVEVQNGKWTYTVQKELTPGDYQVEATLTDTFYNETVVDEQTLTIAYIPLQIELTPTPSSIVGDGKTEVTLKAVIKNALGEPISGETVSFHSELGRLKTAEAITNEKGEATVILVAPDLSGNLQSIVKKVTATVNNPNKGLVDTKSVNITFIPARVKGQVIDSVTKKPVPNAMVKISEDTNGDGVIDFEASVKTNANGEYDIAVPNGNYDYKLQITTTMTVEGVEVPVTFTQVAKVGETSGLGEEQKSEHTVIGQLFMTNEETGKPETITSMVPGALFVAKPIGEVSSNVSVDITPSGQYIITGGEKGESYTFAITVIVKDENGNEVILAGQKMTVTIPEDGVASIESTLIDPYGIVRDPDTLEPVEGVDMQLYWADTENNKKYNREPHTLVNLPILEDFAPNQNRNNQYTTKDGQYAWMVFADGDYYIIAEKDGYPVYDSRMEGRNEGNPLIDDSYITNGIIHVGQTIVEYNMNMFSKLVPAEEKPSVVNEPPVTEESGPVEVPEKVEQATPVASTPIKVLPKTGSFFTTWTLLMLGTALIITGLAVRGRKKAS